MTILEAKEFIGKCKKALPEYIEVDEKIYKLNAIGIYNSDQYRISYVEYDVNNIQPNAKTLLCQLYVVNDDIGTIDYSQSFFKHFNSVDDMIRDFQHQIVKIPYSVVTEPVTRETQFERDLTSLLNRYSKENDSNTPDFLLAEHMIGCLKLFNAIVGKREKWYGRGKSKSKTL